MEPLYKLNSGNRVNIEDKKIFIEDATGVIGSTNYIEDLDNPGTYIAVNNTTGYGETTKQRSALALFLLAHVKKTTGNIPVDIKAYNPLTVTEFEASFVEDGWYEFSLIALDNVPAPDPALFDEGTVVYDTTALAIVRKEGDAFVPATLDSLYDTNYVKAVSNKAVIPDTLIYMIQLNDQKNKLLFKGEEDTPEVKRIQTEYSNLRGLLVAANNQFRQKNYYIFQKHIEFLNSNIC